MSKKKLSEGVRDRFLEAKDHIIGNKICGVATLSQFAIKVGEYTQNFSKMENGERYPTIESICLMCTEFGVSSAWLLLKKGTMYGEPKNSDVDALWKEIFDLKKKVDGKKPVKSRKK